MAFKFSTLETLNESIDFLVDALAKKYGSYEGAPETRRKQVDRMREMMMLLNEHHPLAETTLSEAFTHLNRLIAKEIDNTYWIRSSGNSVFRVALDRAIGIDADNKFDAEAEKIAQEAFEKYQNIMDKILLLSQSDTMLQNLYACVKANKPTSPSNENVLAVIDTAQLSSWWSFFNKKNASENVHPKNMYQEETEDDFLRKITL